MSEVKVNKISPRTNCGTVTVGDSGDSVSVSAGVPVTVNGDLKSNALKATDGGSIISQSGTNITIGASGDTVSLASGASQSGFGRTGTVNWNTTKITADPGNAVSGVGYFTDTSGGAFNVTLPSSPSAGDIVAVADYANTWDTNNLTVARNSSNIEGEASDFICNIEGGSITFVYVDATKGWIVTNTGQSGDATESKFVTATGGTITTVCTNFKVHTFTGPGTFTVTCAGNAVGSNTVSYMVVAGGGAGGGGVGGGGGAGGFRFYASPSCNPQSGPGAPLNGPAAITVSAQAYPITVGSGGAGDQSGASGSNSSFSTITSSGGGFGANPTGPLSQAGKPGGSGGGAGGGGGLDNSGGTGNQPPVTPAQGRPGGNSSQAHPDHASGGGGGAIQDGFDGRGPTPGPANSGAGGAGAGITGFGSSNGQCSSCVQYFSGGGGGGQSVPVPLGGGAGGIGGGAPAGAPPGNDGTANTGGGAGGDRFGPTPGAGGSGGSGIVVIRYKFQ